MPGAGEGDTGFENSNTGHGDTGFEQTGGRGDGYGSGEITSNPNESVTGFSKNSAGPGSHGESQRGTTAERHLRGSGARVSLTPPRLFSPFTSLATGAAFEAPGTGEQKTGFSNVSGQGYTGFDADHSGESGGFGEAHGGGGGESGGSGGGIKDKLEHIKDKIKS